jgi:hypothetical protein
MKSPNWSETLESPLNHIGLTVFRPGEAARFVSGDAIADRKAGSLEASTR